MISVRKSDFTNGYAEKTTKLKYFSNGTSYNAFRFNVLLQIMTIEGMHDNDLDQQGDCGNPKVWIKQERI